MIRVGSRSPHHSSKLPSHTNDSGCGSVIISNRPEICRKKFLKLYATQKKTTRKASLEVQKNPPLPGTSIPSKTNFLDRLCMTASFHHSFPSLCRGPPDQPEHIVKCVLAVCGFNLPVTHLYVAGIRGTGAGRKFKTASRKSSFPLRKYASESCWDWERFDLMKPSSFRGVRWKCFKKESDMFFLVGCFFEN